MAATSMYGKERKSHGIVIHKPKFTQIEVAADLPPLLVLTFIYFPTTKTFWPTSIKEACYSSYLHNRTEHKFKISCKVMARQVAVLLQPDLLQKYTNMFYSVLVHILHNANIIIRSRNLNDRS